MSSAKNCARQYCPDCSPVRRSQGQAPRTGTRAARPYASLMQHGKAPSNHSVLRLIDCVTGCEALQEDLLRSCCPAAGLMVKHNKELVPTRPRLRRLAVCCGSTLPTRVQLRTARNPAKIETEGFHSTFGTDSASAQLSRTRLPFLVIVVLLYLLLTFQSTRR